MQHHAGLELAAVIARNLEVRLRIDAIPPVDSADENAALRLQFADHLLEIVPAVAVQNDELLDSLPFQRMGNIGQNRRLSTRVHVDAEADVELAGIHPKRNLGKDDDASSGVPRAPRCLPRHVRGFVVVGSVRKMKVVRFSRAPGKHRDFVVRRAHCLPRHFTQQLRLTRHGRSSMYGVAPSVSRNDRKTDA